MANKLTVLDCYQEKIHYAQNLLLPVLTLILYRTADAVDFFENFSFKISKQTVIVLDNARIHVAQKVKERLIYWQKRGLYIFYLPPYSPHLNIIERLWKELKARWLKPEDYISFDNLKYATSECLNQVGRSLKINYSKYC